MLSSANYTPIFQLIISLFTLNFESDIKCPNIHGVTILRWTSNRATSDSSEVARWYEKRTVRYSKITLIWHSWMRHLECLNRIQLSVVK